MHKSIYITIAEENTCAWLKIEDGVRLALEARHIVEEEHARLEAEEEACLTEEAKLKAKEEEYARLEARLKAEEEEEDLRLNAE